MFTVDGVVWVDGSAARGFWDGRTGRPLAQDTPPTVHGNLQERSRKRVQEALISQDAFSAVGLGNLPRMF